MKRVRMYAESAMSDDQERRRAQPTPGSRSSRPGALDVDCVWGCRAGGAVAVAI